MADATPSANAAVSGNLPLYNNPVPLNKDRHKGKGLKFSDRQFDFLKDTHFVPVTFGEFGSVASRFPILFLGENKTAVAAMGLRKGQNLFVDPQTGRFEQFTYLPAFVRRYPFVSASHGQEKDRFTVCVDEGSDLYSDKPDVHFFDDKGELTDFTQRAIDYVRRFEADVRQTQEFTARCEELGLLTQQESKFQPRNEKGEPVGEPQVVATYFGIDGGKLMELDTETFAGLRNNGYLGGMYAAMLSQLNWDPLIQRAAAQDPAQAAQT
ncbi:SapC family protein [Marinicauda pacifica]|jgi:hypothetical protein|uniref:SapC family protein n=1 Tax=Marinicauda pacifica TaxID=1133559 RepID=UPI0035C84555